MAPSPQVAGLPKSSSKLYAGHRSCLHRVSAKVVCSNNWNARASYIKHPWPVAARNWLEAGVRHAVKTLGDKPFLEFVGHNGQHRVHVPAAPVDSGQAWDGIENSMEQAAAMILFHPIELLGEDASPSTGTAVMPAASRPKESLQRTRYYAVVAQSQAERDGPEYFLLKVDSCGVDNHSASYYSMTPVSSGVLLEQQLRSGWLLN